MSENLLPCPFCGCKEIVFFEFDTGDNPPTEDDYMIQCSNDECFCSIDSVSSKEWLTKRWNRRAGGFIDEHKYDSLKYNTLFKTEWIESEYDGKSRLRATGPIGNCGITLSLGGGRTFGKTYEMKKKMEEDMGSIKQEMEAATLCVFCGQKCARGVNLDASQMRLWKGSEWDCGHLECYIDYAVSESIRKATVNYMLKPADETFLAWVKPPKEKPFEEKVEITNNIEGEKE